MRTRNEVERLPIAVIRFAPRSIQGNFDVRFELVIIHWDTSDKELLSSSFVNRAVLQDAPLVFGPAFNRTDGLEDVFASNSVRSEGHFSANSSSPVR